VAAKKGNRPQVRAKRVAQARRAAELARRRRIRRRKQTIGAAVSVVAAVGIFAILLAIGGDGGSDNTLDAAKGSADTTTPADPDQAAGSAAGKPCVPVADPPPPGAPDVPVKVGPPPTTLVKEDLKEGTAAVVAAGQTLTVNYIGVSCSTGKIFDSSYSRNEPATFPLTGVIPGWQEGIPGMKVGGQRLLGIPPDMGYGAQGSPPDIGPGETLWFVVEVLDAKAAAAAPPGQPPSG
jgi:peptidylprolyl isomerase